MSIDAKITELFGVLSKQKAELEAAKKEVDRKWVTNGSIQFDGSNPINIQTASEDTIRRVVAALLQQSEYSAKAATLLGLPIVSKVSGFQQNDWIQDCQKRIAALGIAAKKLKIAELEDRLNAIVSPEQRRQLELEAITRALEA
jgi:hypothetical protein